MADDDERKYYAAIVASSISTVAWIGAVVAAFVTAFHVATGGPALQYARLTIVAVVVAIVFALLEKRLYRVDREE